VSPFTVHSREDSEHGPQQPLITLSFCTLVSKVQYPGGSLLQPPAKRKIWLLKMVQCSGMRFSAVFQLPGSLLLAPWSACQPPGKPFPAPTVRFPELFLGCYFRYVAPRRQYTKSADLLWYGARLHRANRRSDLRNRLSRLVKIKFHRRCRPFLAHT
jgi:hypothetical protein